MDKPLIQLQDGAILEFSEDHYSSSGCESCDYGSSYVQDFTVKTSAGDFRRELSQMYDYPISHDFLFKAILPNVALFNTMTIREFIAWLDARFGEAGKEGTDFSVRTI